MCLGAARTTACLPFFLIFSQFSYSSIDSEECGSSSCSQVDQSPRLMNVSDASLLIQYLALGTRVQIKSLLQQDVFSVFHYCITYFYPNQLTHPPPPPSFPPPPMNSLSIPESHCCLRSSYVCTSRIEPRHKNNHILGSLKLIQIGAIVIECVSACRAGDSRN